MGFFDRFKKRSAVSPEAFWSWFEQNAARYHGLTPDRATSELYELGAKLSDASGNRLVWEMSKPDSAGICEFVISADGLRDCIPLVKQFVECAPDIAGFRIVAFRQRDEKGPSILCNGVSLDWDSLRFRCERSAGKLNVEIYVDGLTEASRREVTNAAFLVLDSLLGEYAVMTCLGRIDFLPLVAAGSGHRPLRELLDEVEMLPGIA